MAKNERILNTSSFQVPFHCFGRWQFFDQPAKLVVQHPMWKTQSIFNLTRCLSLRALILVAGVALTQAHPITPNLQGYRPLPGFRVVAINNALAVTWPAGTNQIAEVQFNLDSTQPLIDFLSVQASTGGKVAVGHSLNPALWLTVGARDLKNPAGWVAFFDDPNSRPHQTYQATGERAFLRVTNVGTRVEIHVGPLKAGSFHGEWCFTAYPGSGLLRMEAALSTAEDGRAILYDAGLVSGAENWQRMVWHDVTGQLQGIPVMADTPARSVKVAGRTLVAETAGGSLAVFPPPHQFFYPVDQVTNLNYTWFGRGYGGSTEGCGLGICQSATGFNHYVPWFNAPPGTDLHLGVFYLLSSQPGLAALASVAAYTHEDHYPAIPGHVTFTSHYHIEHTQELLRRQAELHTNGIPAELAEPGFVKTFKARGVNLVHLAEFHLGIDAPRLTTEKRLPLLQAMFTECQRLSDAQLLVIPGEEADVHLGGHWLALFPKPVYWVLNRGTDQPFVESRPGIGPVYHVGSAAEVYELMQREHGLMWTAHARIKGSREYPDKYWNADFFKSPEFLGAAWKAMPADLSQPRMGSRVLDLMDEMENLGLHKQVIGEVDAFRMEPEYETYAHMNINYLQLDHVPAYTNGWQPVLDTLRRGEFFTTTGEILMPQFTVAGQPNGATVALAGKTEVPVEFTLDWTFPLAFAELISGDGQHVYRQRVDLRQTASFGHQTWRLPAAVTGRKWLRLEVWDVAANGAFSQPVWFTE